MEKSNGKRFCTVLESEDNIKLSLMEKNTHSKLRLIDKNVYQSLNTGWIHLLLGE
jgi:hypothetical protein